MEFGFEYEDRTCVDIVSSQCYESDSDGLFNMTVGVGKYRLVDCTPFMKYAPTDFTDLLDDEWERNPFGGTLIEYPVETDFTWPVVGIFLGTIVLASIAILCH